MESKYSAIEMNYKGLFIGIDKYESSGVRWLSCAANDAMAMHGLFCDNLGVDSTCLIDEKATKSEILKALSDLQTVDETDFVLLTFSGHGTSTHELLCYDSNEAELSNTSISFDELFQAIEKIPSKRMICILDCCFSGGYGTRSVKNDFAPRNYSSQDILAGFSGNGKLVLTASAGDEPAWEDAKSGHGLLSYSFLKQLQVINGPTESLNIFELVMKVCAEVTKLAQEQGKVQTPTFHGKMEAGFSFPYLTPGKTFYTYFPQLSHRKISAEVGSLSELGFSQEVIALWKDIPSFNALQISAVNDYGLLEGKNLLVSAPTSSGKTLIGELAAISCALKRKRSIFLLPLKALVNDKYQEFTRKYDSQGIKVIRATGDVSDQVPALIRGRYDICLMTYEKFASTMLGLPHLIEQIGLIVIDEVQMITDKSRGVNLEFLLTVIKSKQQYGISPQLICLSAVIGETNGFEHWLGCGFLKQETRPVPLLEGLVLYDGSIKTIDSLTQETAQAACISPERVKNSDQDYIKPLVRKLVSEGKQVIVFRPSKGEARGAARYLAEYLTLPPAADLLAKLPTTDLSDASNRLRYTLAAGVAFHISDLDAVERLLVEETFRMKESKIRVIVATTTLAMGINTPAEAVIISGLEHPGKTPTPYSVAEYKNIVGRAGRLGFAERGYSYLLGTSSVNAHNYWLKYILGKAEDINSRIFNEFTDLRSLIVRLLVSFPKRSGEIYGASEADIIDFLTSSFGAFQRATNEVNWTMDPREIAKCLDNLKTNQLLTKNPANRYQLTALGRLAGESGVEVESVIRMSSMINALSASEVSDPLLIVLCQLSTELNDIYVPINSKGATKEMNSWKNELQGQGISYFVLSALGQNLDDRTAASRYKKATACLFWIGNSSMSDIENTMTRHGGRFDGFSGPMRSAASRTRDLIPVAARIAEIFNPGLELGERIEKLHIRLELGIPSSLCVIAKYLGNSFSRGDYHGLMKIGLREWKDVENLEQENLLNVLSGNEDKLNLLRQTAKIALGETDRFRENIPFLSLPKYEG
jgi:helicase